MRATHAFQWSKALVGPARSLALARGTCQRRPQPHAAYLPHRRVLPRKLLPLVEKHVLGNGWQLIRQVRGQGTCCCGRGGGRDEPPARAAAWGALRRSRRGPTAAHGLSFRPGARAATYAPAAPTSPATPAATQPPLLAGDRPRRSTSSASIGRCCKPLLGSRKPRPRGSHPSACAWGRSLARSTGAAGARAGRAAAGAVPGGGASKRVPGPIIGHDHPQTRGYERRPAPTGLQATRPGGGLGPLRPKKRTGQAPWQPGTPRGRKLAGPLQHSGTARHPRRSACRSPGTSPK
jgi:hypothetical protein